MAPISRNLLLVAIAVYLVVIVVSGFKLLKLNLKHVEQTNKLENKILETQLKLKEQQLDYLKMQIHPHFLFNTLNTMYGFALKKADQAPEMILKLSNLLDYLLYKVDKPFVLLTDDIDHIEDYIELEKMRFNETLSISFLTKNISKDIKIAPMLLLPFIENSFKHGAIKNGMLTIKITLTCKDKMLLFDIENTSTQSEPHKNGIGLENIQKRLDLLYKDNYILDITKNTNFFKVNLVLNTNTSD
ncbi:sensor histidine kinase [Flavivirga eckloniae]|nr:histidine kinase [Flavivirga eckloniae]